MCRPAAGRALADLAASANARLSRPLVIAIGRRALDSGLESSLRDPQRDPDSRLERAFASMATHLDDLRARDRERFFKPGLLVYTPIQAQCYDQ